MTESKHTPVPWRAERDNGTRVGHSTLLGANDLIISEWVWLSDDAAHIVKCVNAHDVMLEALKLVVSQARTYGDFTNLNQSGIIIGKTTIITLEAAIEKAEGDKP